MKIEDLIIYGKKHVHSDHAKMILADLLNINTLELYNYLDKEIDIDICNKYFEKIDQLESNNPVQYIIGNVNFFGLKLNVNKNVLIPRFETEELVENTLILIKEHFKNNNLNIIDLGCGSGAIGLSLKYKLKESNVTLLDISDYALELSKTNSANLGLDVKIIKGNMLEDISDKYDVIISNPPYIREDEEIEKIVYDNEPHLALYGGSDGLKFYKMILSKAHNNVNEDFLIAFEIGDLQKDQIIDLVYKYFNNVDIICKKDLSNRDRMLFIMNKK